MPIFKNLKNLASDEIAPCPPSWPLVFHLLITHESLGHSNLGAAVAASGEAAIFSYERDSIEPLYFNTIGGHARLKICTGYETKNLRTNNAEKAFTFIKEGIDTGHGLFIAGPEIGLCYGYEYSGSIDKREIYGFSNWGPAFHGTYSWTRFSKHVEVFGQAEGLAYVTYETQPEAAAKILEMIGQTIIDWQDRHPACQFGMIQDYYGLAAFKKFIEDVSDPEIRSQIDKAYINCHAIQFQLGGRYWLGVYIKQLAQQFKDNLKKQILEIGDLYIKIYKDFKRFADFNMTDEKNENEIQKSINWLKEAYDNDEKILEKFISLRGVL